MGVQIITGGGAAQFGAGLGKGLNEGIDTAQRLKRAEEEKQALADELKAVQTAMVEPKLRALEGQIPNDPALQGPEPVPGHGQLAPGVQGPPIAPEITGAPGYMRPEPSPERAQLDTLAGQFAQSLRSMKDPRAIEAMGQAYAQQLDVLQRQILVRKVNDQLSTAEKTGAFDQSEIQEFLAMGAEIAQGQGDIADLYTAIRERKEEKVKEKVNLGRATRFLEQAAINQANFAQSAQQTNDPDESAWLNSQAGDMADTISEIQAALEFGLDDFDFDAAYERVADVKHRLNPYQKQRMEQENMRMRSYYDAREQILTDPTLRSRSAEMLKALNDEYGVDIPAPKSMQGAASPEHASPVAGEPEVETANDRSMEGKTPEEVQAIEAKRQVIGQLDGVNFSGMDAEQVDSRLTDQLGALAESLSGGPVEIEIPEGGTEQEAWADHVFGIIEQIQAEDPQYAQLLAGRIVRMIDMAEEAKTAKAEKKKRDSKPRYDDDMGSAAWGGS